MMRELWLLLGQGMHRCSGFEGHPVVLGRLSASTATVCHSINPMGRASFYPVWELDTPDSCGTRIGLHGSQEAAVVDFLGDR